MPYSAVTQPSPLPRVLERDVPRLEVDEVQRDRGRDDDGQGDPRLFADQGDGQPDGDGGDERQQGDLGQDRTGTRAIQAPASPGASRLGISHLVAPFLR
jgi:hypothetical protein